MILVRLNGGHQEGEYIANCEGYSFLPPPWDQREEMIDSFWNGIEDILYRWKLSGLARDTSVFVDAKFELNAGGVSEYFEASNTGNMDEWVRKWNVDPPKRSKDPLSLSILRLTARSISFTLNELNLKDEKSAISFFRGKFENLANNLICMMNIARPGVFSLAFNDDHGSFGSSNTFNSFYRYPKECKDEFGYPEPRHILFNEVWEWYSSLSGVMFGNTKTDVERATAIFTRLFRQHYKTDEMQDIVWSVSGLECLLSSDGGEKIGSALKNKISAAIPGISSIKGEFSNHLNSLYKIRSSLVHGAENFQGRFHLGDNSGNLMKFEAFGAMLLTSLLQVAAMRRLDKLEFTTTLR